MNKIGGLVVNLSADTMEQADTYHELGMPVTVVLPEDAPNMGKQTPTVYRLWFVLLRLRKI